MKQALCLTLFIFATRIVFGQFETCNSGTTKHLHDVYFIDAQTGIAVGDSGTIIRSIDAGLNWNTVLSVDTAAFRKITFFDNQIGLAIGSDMYRTVDGGQNWYLIDLPNSFYMDLAVLNETDCLISGYPNRLVKSTDKGDSWQLLYSDTSSMNFGFLSFVNENQGFASLDGNSSTLHNIALIDDGGDTWTIQEATESGSPVVLEAFEFISPQVGFFGGCTFPT